MMLAVIILLSPAVLGLIYMYIESRMLITRRYRIKSGLKNEIRAVHLSDIHKKKYAHDWERLVTRVKALDPDVIFITGDIVSRMEREFGYKGVLIKRLSEICPVYLCRGNHELDLPKGSMDKLREDIAGNGGILLENEKAVFQKGDTALDIWGADLRRSVYRNAKNGFSGLYRYTDDDLKAELGKPDGAVNILLAHTPFFLDSYAKWGADIVLSGHVHGGVVWTPFGGLLSPERKFFPKYDKGLFTSGKTKMILSAGIGKIRLFDPPEIILLTIS